MKEFFEALGALQEESEAESEFQFRYKVMSRLCKFFDLEEPPREETECTWAWFQEQYPHFPLRLESRKVIVSVAQMFYAITRTEAWGEYWVVYEESGNKLLAVFVPVRAHGVFVLHNCWQLPAMPGHTRLTRVAASGSGERGIIFEPLGAFLESVKRSGWTP